MASMTKVDKDQNRAALVQAIISATKPERTGTFCWDGFQWMDHSHCVVLRMHGDHGTPSFDVQFDKHTPKRYELWAVGGNVGHIRPAIVQASYNLMQGPTTLAASIVLHALAAVNEATRKENRNSSCIRFKDSLKLFL